MLPTRASGTSYILCPVPEKSISPMYPARIAFLPYETTSRNNWLGDQSYPSQPSSRSDSLLLASFHYQFLKSLSNPCRSQSWEQAQHPVSVCLNPIFLPEPPSGRPHSAKISRALWLVRFSG